MRKRQNISMAEMNKVLINCELNCPTLSAYYSAGDGKFKKDNLVSRLNWNRNINLDQIAKKACFYSISCANAITYFAPLDDDNNSFLKNFYERIRNLVKYRRILHSIFNIYSAKKSFFEHEDLHFTLSGINRYYASTDIEVQISDSENCLQENEIASIYDKITGEKFYKIDFTEGHSYFMRIYDKKFNSYNQHGCLFFDSYASARWWQKQILTRVKRNLKNNDCLTSLDLPL